MAQQACQSVARGPPLCPQGGGSTPCRGQTCSVHCKTLLCALRPGCRTLPLPCWFVFLLSLLTNTVTSAKNNTRPLLILQRQVLHRQRGHRAASLPGMPPRSLAPLRLGSLPKAGRSWQGDVPKMLPSHPRKIMSSQRLSPCLKFRIFAWKPRVPKCSHFHRAPQKTAKGKQRLQTERSMLPS